MILSILFILTAVFGFSFGRQKKGLVVLMYHKITEADNNVDRFTVSANQLSQQLSYLCNQGYKSISLSELLNPCYKFQDKTFLLTFDDGYKDNLQNMYPLLKKFNAKCCIFLVANYVALATKKSDYLSTDDIQQFDAEVVEFGLHSYNHKSYNKLTPEEISDDIKLCKKAFTHLGIEVLPVLAYPYGAYPKTDKARQKEMFTVFSNHNIKMAFRIGNRINSFPFHNNFLVERIEVKGTDSLGRFKRKISRGKCFPF